MMTTATDQTIFGHSLFFVLTTGFDEARLEQVVAGHDI